MSSVIHGLDIAFAFAAAVAAFSSLNRMSEAMSLEVKLTFALTFATVGAAMLGQVFILAMPDKWQAVINTLAYGGIAALLIASRRRSLFVHEIWMTRIALGVLLVTWFVFFVGIE